MTTRHLANNRIPWIDNSRFILIISMVAYHIYWDLCHFNYITQTAKIHTYSQWFAHLTATGFIMLSGFSLFISYKQKSTKTFLYNYVKRNILILLSAISISIVTYLYFRNEYIYFGILHQIFFSSIICLLLLRTNYLIDLALASVILLLAIYCNFTNSNFLSLVGLSYNVKPSLDFVPIFPWTAFSIIGLALGKLYYPFYKPRYSNTNQMISFISKHSLIIYLTHQPIIFGVLLLITPQYNKTFIYQCHKICLSKNANEQFCRKYCYCMNEKVSSLIVNQNLIDPLSKECINYAYKKAGMEPSLLLNNHIHIK